MTIKRTHIIKQNSWEINSEDKDLLATFKKHSYPKICGNLKLYKFKKNPKLI
jgi:hypothetical protein